MARSSPWRRRRQPVGEVVLMPTSHRTRSPRTRWPVRDDPVDRNDDLGHVDGAVAGTSLDVDDVGTLGNARAGFGVAAGDDRRDVRAVAVQVAVPQVRIERVERQVGSSTTLLLPVSLAVWLPPVSMTATPMSPPERPFVFSDTSAPTAIRVSSRSFVTPSPITVRQD